MTTPSSARTARPGTARLPEIWLEIAEAIGYEPFMRMWMLLDRENLASRGMRENIRLWIPQARSYFRFQRNQYIKTLGNSGMTVPEIRGRIQVELGDDLSDRSIARVLSKIQHLEE